LVETEAADNSQAWAVLGMAYDWNGDVEEAVEACLRSVELDPTNAEAYACLAEAYADARQWAEATEAAQMSIELDDRSVDAHRNYGYVLEVQGNWTSAIEQYEKALAIHPNLAHIHVSVGQNYRALGNIDQAIESFKRALEIQPDSARTSFELGWTYLIYLGEYEQAETHLARATELDPEFGRAFGALAITYWAERHYEAAIPAFEKAIALETRDTRRAVERFLLTVEGGGAELTLPSSEVMLEGDFVPVNDERQRRFQATLEPASVTGSAGGSGTVELDAVSGDYTIEANGLPRLAEGETYVGWFMGVATLSGPPLNTGPLRVNTGGTISSEDTTGYVAGPSIEYFYTLGLAHYYKENCERAIPLFLAALEMNPEEPNALEGLSYCRE
jgi:tetratricopeptide (TPR) repeat protein